MTEIVAFVTAAAGIPIYASADPAAAVVATLAASEVATVTGDIASGRRPIATATGAGWIDESAAEVLPQLVVDLFRDDDRGRPAWAAVMADHRYVGAILKATEGVRYPTAWFAGQWPAVRAAAGDRYGASWFRGAYHYLLFDTPAAAQAEFFARTVEAAGGWDAGDLIPIVDVERGATTASNRRASAAQVVDVVSGYVTAIKAATGQRVLLYGRGAMRDLGITSRFGADYLWNPGYTATMPSAAAEGWPDALVPLWQFSDGTANHTRWPTEAPGLGRVDTSVHRGADLRALRDALVRRVVAQAPSAG